jgi:hypothetical protein
MPFAQRGSSPGVRVPEPASPKWADPSSSRCIFGSARPSEAASPGTTTSPRSLNRPVSSPTKQGRTSPRSSNRPVPPAKQESELSRSASSPDGFSQRTAWAVFRQQSTIFSQAEADIRSPRNSTQRCASPESPRLGASAWESQILGSPQPKSRSSPRSSTHGSTLADSPVSPRRAAWAAKRTESQVLHDQPAAPSPSLSPRIGVAPWMDPYKEEKKQSKFDTNNAHEVLNKAGSPYSFNLYERRGVGEFSPRNPNRTSSSPTTKQQLSQSLSLFDTPISCQPDMSFRKASPLRDRSPSPGGEPEGQPAGKEGRGMAKSDSWRCMRQYNSTGDLDSNWKRGVGEFSPRARAESPAGDDSRFNFIAGAESRISDSHHLGRDVASPRDNEHARRLNLDNAIKMTREASLPILLGLTKPYVPPEDFAATILPSSTDYEDLLHRPGSPRKSLSKPPVPMRPLELRPAAGERNERRMTPRSRSSPEKSRTRMLPGDVLTQIAALKPSPSSASTACSGSTPGQTPRDAIVAELQMFGQRRRHSVTMQQTRQHWNNTTSTGKSPREKELAGNPYSARASYEQVPAGVTSNRCRTTRSQKNQPDLISSPRKPAPRTYPSMAASLPSRPRRQSQEGPEAMRPEKVREPPYFRSNQATRRSPRVDGSPRVRESGSPRVRESAQAL